MEKLKLTLVALLALMATSKADVTDIPADTTKLVNTIKSEITNQISGIGKAIDGITSTANDIPAQATNLAKSVEKTFTDTVSASTTFANSLVTDAQKIPKKINDAVSILKGQIETKAINDFNKKNISDGIKTVLDSVDTFTKTTVDSSLSIVSSTSTNLQAMLKTIISTNWKGSIDQIVAILQDTSKILTTVLNQFKQLTASVKTIVDAALKIAADVADMKDTQTTLNTTFTDIDNVIGAIQAHIKQVNETIESIQNQAKQIN